MKEQNQGTMLKKHGNRTGREILDKSAVSSRQSLVDELVRQATEAGIIVNGRKT